MIIMRIYFYIFFFSMLKQGLKWDIDEAIAKEMGFGKFLSSSNEFLDENQDLEVECELPAIFTSALNIVEE